MSSFFRRGAILLPLLLVAAAPAFSQNTFYEAYSRGIDLEKRENWSEARKAFLQAAALHPEPQRRVKAHGPNVIRFYDPYARLAHCEMRLGMFDEAARHLETSQRAGVTPEPFLRELEAGIRRGIAEKTKAQHAAPREAPRPVTSASEPKKPSRKPETSGQTARPSQPPGSSVHADESKPEQSVRGFQISKREIAMMIALVAVIAVSGWMLLRGKVPEQARPAVAAATDPTSLSATPARAPKPEDTPTQALDDLDAARRPAATPVAIDFTEVKKNAIPMKEGAITDFGAYTLEGILGRGGMGTTYLARRKRDGLPVAVKVPHEHLLDNEEFAQRFLREGALGSTLHHPNIIRIYEADRLGNQPYIVMELIEGETLEKKLRRERNLPLHEALETARDIALALDYARLKGVVHRDLKPDNIMILKRGGLKVMDYGIARIVGSPGLTASESYLGTPTYSAPEATSGKADQQSDLYSLGIVLYRMLTGDPPFRSTDPIEVLQMHRSTPLPPFPKELEVPEAVARLVKTLTQKNKTERYPDAESFLIDLNGVMKHL